MLTKESEESRKLIHQSDAAGSHSGKSHPAKSAQLTCDTASAAHFNLLPYRFVLSIGVDGMKEAGCDVGTLARVKSNLS